MSLLFRVLPVLLLLGVACSEGPASTGPGSGRGDRSRGGPGGWGGSDREAATAVPVEVVPVVRRAISSYIETNGTLEAENEVDIVARTADPIIELLVEEGDAVREGQLLARLDDQQHRADFDIARVTLNETRLAFERAKKLQGESLISPETYEQALSDYETAQAQFEGARIQLGYTEIRAPFGGLIIARYVNLAEQVSVNAPLFRVSDFTPLLCPIQVPERELPRLIPGQRAYVTVESFPGERFDASVLRIRPVIDAETGTVKVTLQIQARDKLRPGMFARVYVETDVRRDSLVIPKAALSLESIGDTVYVVADGATAARREVQLGFREGDHVEVREGLADGEQIVVVGQDGLSDGTPVQVLDGVSVTATETLEPAAEPRERGRGRPDFSNMTPERLEQIKERMRARGMTEEQIEERIARMRASQKTGAGQ